MKIANVRAIKRLLIGKVKFFSFAGCSSHQQGIDQHLIDKLFFNFSSARFTSSSHRQRGVSKLLSLLRLINLSSSLNGKHDCSERPQNCTSLEELQKLMKIVTSLLDVCLSSINTGVSNMCLSLHFKRSN